MQFSEDLSFQTFNDSWQTFNNYFNDGSVTFEQFYRATKGRKLVVKLLRDIIKEPPENVSVDRIRAKSIAEAYPENDRPRGDADITSVQHQMKSLVSPVVIVEWTVGGKTRNIFLDGMHRLVAAKLSKKRKIPAFIITLLP